MDLGPHKGCVSPAGSSPGFLEGPQCAWYCSRSHENRSRLSHEGSTPTQDNESSYTQEPECGHSLPSRHGQTPRGTQPGRETELSPFHNFSPPRPLVPQSLTWDPREERRPLPCTPGGECPRPSKKPQPSDAATGMIRDQSHPCSFLFLVALPPPLALISVPGSLARL